MREMGLSEASIRAKTSRLGLKVDYSIEEAALRRAEWNREASRKRTGRKRPDQSLVMRRLHAEGKLKRTAEELVANGKWLADWIATNGHPRGMAGKKHSAETREQLVKFHRERYENMTDEQRDELRQTIIKRRRERDHLRTRAKTARGSWKAGWREIGGQRCFFRSRWEANYARYLQSQADAGQIICWEHEPHTFWFEGVKRGTVSYLPDFRVTLMDGGIEYHEVKGWMDARSKTTIRRMAKYHPDVVLKVIDGPLYRKLHGMCVFRIPGWEGNA